VITGSLYNDQDRPPVNDDGQVVLHLPLAAADSDAVKLLLHSGDTRSIELALGSGLTILLQDDDPVVKLEVDGGKATVQIDRDGAVSVKSQGDITIEAQGNLAFKGAEINVEAQATLTLKGATVNIN
jgi:ankyrin repeat protein